MQQDNAQRSFDFTQAVNCFIKTIIHFESSGGYMPEITKSKRSGIEAFIFSFKGEK